MAGAGLALGEEELGKCVGERGGEKEKRGLEIVKWKERRKKRKKGRGG